VVGARLGLVVRRDARGCRNPDATSEAIESELVTIVRSAWFTSSRATPAVVVPPESATACRSRGMRMAAARAMRRFASWNRVSRSATGSSASDPAAFAPPWVRTMSPWSASTVRSRRRVAAELWNNSASSVSETSPRSAMASRMSAMRRERLGEPPSSATVLVL
jgi:hypothetical protein